MLSIAFGQAKYYVDNLSQNVHRGLKYKIKTGVWPARAPMGYRNDRNTKSIVVYEPEARPLRKAFELYSTGKYALDDIGAFLFEHGMKNKYSGGQLNDSNLRRVLMRPFYTGYMVFKGEMYEGAHTPLISKELFDKVQKARKQRGYFHQNKSKRYDFAFTGFMKCFYCGCSITAEHRPFFFPRTNHKADYIYYHCTKKKGECCQKGYTREEILEKQFREIIKGLLVSQSWVDQMNTFLAQDIETQKVEDKNESLRLETEVAQTEQKLDTLLEAYLDTVIDSESYIKKKNELMERKSNLVSKTKELGSENPFWIEGVKDFVNCAQMCAKIARAENNCHDLAIMAKKVGSKYFLKDSNIEFCLNFPYKLLAAGAGAASHSTEFVPTLAFGQAKYYVDNLSQNVQRGLRYKIKRGIWPARAPWGYCNDRNTRGIVIHPHEAKVIKGAFELYATGKYALIDIGKYFYENGIKNKLTGWYPNDSNLRRILMRPLYYGAMVFKGELYEGIHEPIVSKALFDQVQKIIIQRGWYHQYKSKRYDFAFTGFIKCGYCGCSITAENRPFYFPRTHNSVSYRYYHCTKKKLPCLEKGYTREEVLEQQFREIIQSVSLSEAWVNKMLELLENDAQTEKQQTKQELENLTFELTDIEKKLDRLLEAYLETIVETENYKQKKNELMEKQSVLKDRINQLKTGNLFWVERMKEFVFCAQECAKIARAENNGHLLSQMAKKVGSKYFLKDHRIEFSLLPPYKALAAWAGAASATEPSDRILAFGQSKYYVDNLSENVKRGLYFKLRHGGWPSVAPLGYKSDRNTRTVVVEPKTARLVKESFKSFASGEFSSMKEVRDLLFRNGIARRNSKPLHFNQIRGVLTRTFYYGLMTYHGETYEGKHKPLITKRLFDEVQKVLAKKYSKKPQKHEFDFTGFIKCKECDSFITAENHKKYYRKTDHHAEYVYYRCVKKKGDCSQKYIPQAELENQLRETISRFSLPESWRVKMLEMADSDGKKDRKFAEGELHKQSTILAELEKKLDKLLESYLEEIIDTESYQKKKDELLQTKKILQEKITEIKMKGSSWLEPLKEFIKEAADAAKIARAKNNCKDLAIFAKKVGSNYFLNDKRLEFLPVAPFNLLAAPAPAASHSDESLQMCSQQESNLQPSR